jgi:hypothetical protein
MRRSGTRSWWSIRADQWEEAPEIALWVRAAERIDAPAGGPVPGPLDISPVPDPTMRSSDELSRAWVLWWTAIVQRGVMTTPDGSVSFSGEWAAVALPDFAGLGQWPALQSVVRARWMEAKRWHDARKRRALQGDRSTLFGPSLTRTGAKLDEWGRRLDREVSIELLVLPVVDDEIRTVGENRCLLSESLYGSPAFDETLATFLDLRLRRQYGSP